MKTKKKLKGDLINKNINSIDIKNKGIYNNSYYNDIESDFDIINFIHIFINYILILIILLITFNKRQRKKKILKKKKKILKY